MIGECGVFSCRGVFLLLLTGICLLIDAFRLAVPSL
jgi:hypothetical protein